MSWVTPSITMTQPMTVRRQAARAFCKSAGATKPSTSGATGGRAQEKRPVARRVARSLDPQRHGRDRRRQGVFSERDRGTRRRAREDVLDRDGAKPPAVGPVDRRDLHEAQPERRTGHEQVLRTDDALGGNVGRPSAPGASLDSDGVVDRDRDVVGVGTGRLARWPAGRTASAPLRDRPPDRAPPDWWRCWSPPRPGRRSFHRIPSGRATRPARPRWHRSGRATIARGRLRQDRPVPPQ